MKTGDFRLWRSKIACWWLFGFFFAVTVIWQFVVAMNPKAGAHRDWLVGTIVFGSMAVVCFILACYARKRVMVIDTQPETRKIRISSYVFGILCILCGVCSFHVISQFRRIFDELLRPVEISSLPLLSKAIYDFPSMTWSIIFVLIGLLVIAKDLMACKKYWGTVLFVIFVAYVILLVIGCFEPLIGMHGG